MSQQDAMQMRAGGVDITNKGSLDIGGDVIGRDKNTYYYSLPPLPEIDVDAAVAWVTQMPVDELPPHAPYHAGSPYQHDANPHFVGRENALRQLARQLRQPHARAAIGQAALTGMGGIGKTQLAVEFVHRYGQYFKGGVYWLNFAAVGLHDDAQIESQLAEWGGAVTRRDFVNLDAPARLALVKQALNAPLPRLLIFDNLDDPAAPRLLQKWRPKTGGCRVLVTSRRGVWGRNLGVAQIRLETLSPAESHTLLGDLAPRLSEAEAAQVARRLGYFPLALYLAGSYLGSNTRPVARFLARYERKRLDHPAMAGKGADDYSPTDHDLSVYATFAVSWEQLEAADAVDQLAIRLMQHAACLAPNEPIPRALLTATLAERDDWPLDNDDADELEDALDDALRRLKQLGLLDEELRLHRLLGEFVGVEATAQTAVEAGTSAEAYRLNTAGYPAPLRAWRRHLNSTT